MKTPSQFCLVGLLGLVLFAGCGDKPREPAHQTTPQTTPATTTPPAATSEEATTFEEAAEIEKALAQLSPEDRKRAELQKICPVAQEPLGSMGKPELVEVNGQKVFICCEGCRKPLLAKPAKYLANLPPAASPVAP